jgi:hypothetical protein
MHDGIIIWHSDIIQHRTFYYLRGTTCNKLAPHCCQKQQIVVTIQQEKEKKNIRVHVCMYIRILVVLIAVFNANSSGKISGDERQDSPHF